jgi:hypothetical protein
MRRTAWGLTAIFVLLILAGPSACRRTSYIGVLISSCDPPCWAGIAPGGSSPDDIVQSLEDLAIVQDGSMTISQFPGLERERIFWRFTSEYQNATGIVDVHEGTALLIRLNTADRTTLQDVITLYGEPEFVSAIETQGEARWLTFTFLWPSTGVAAVAVRHLFTTNETESVVEPFDAVGEVILFRPADYSALLDARDLFGRDRSWIENTILPWPGFGVIPHTVLPQ